MGMKKFHRHCPGIEREPLSESEMSMICIMNRAYRSWPKGMETLPVGLGPKAIGTQKKRTQMNNVWKS
jgi:hypothetical protein